MGEPTTTDIKELMRKVADAELRYATMLDKVRRLEARGDREAEERVKLYDRVVAMVSAIDKKIDDMATIQATWSGGVKALTAAIVLLVPVLAGVMWLIQHGAK